MRIFVLLMLMAVMSGCGSDQVPTYPVRGRVEFPNGTPVRNGTVELESIEHQTTATGKIQRDGSFVLGTYTADDGAAAGQHKAIVIQLVVADGSFKHTVDHGKPVPTKFSDYETSSLTASVKADADNKIVLVIE